MEYSEFVASKLAAVPPCGFSPPRGLRVPLAEFQSDLVRWSLRRGRAAIFADTGLGKTRMQLAWASAVAKKAGKGARVLILAPLAVAKQTASEGEAVGVAVTVCRDGSDVRPGVNVTNYDRLHRFDPGEFCAVVLDESSCIKHHDTKTLAALLESFRATPYRLCCTATPAPNDWTELGTHAEFLGVCSRTEMLSEFFCHDGGETQVWRLKGHARSAFWRWVSSWGAMVKSPADLGHDASAYALPELRLHEHLVRSDWRPADGALFAEHAETLTERRDARKQSVVDRVRECAAAVAAEPGESWVIWCDLNAEGDALRAAIPEAVEIRGSDDLDAKEQRLDEFAAGGVRVLVTKPSIAGFGLNWQHCARMAFVGVTDSWESYYQAVRRCWRFGQKRPVEVHIFAAESEGAVVANLRRKEADAAALAAALAAETREAVRAEVRGAVRSTNDYDPQTTMEVPAWLAA